MALYFYRALSKEGKRITGYLDAGSQDSVKNQLTKQGLYPVSIELAQKEDRQAWWRRLFSRGVSSKDKIIFTRQLSVLLRSGVPVVQALELLTEQFQGRLHSILITVKDAIKEGVALADALSNYPAVFDTVYVQLVRAGEASGKLDTILVRLTNYLERREEVQKKIKGALRYPIIQLSIAMLVVLVLMWAVVPTMAGVFKAQKQELPTITAILITLSNFFQNYTLWVLVGLFAVIVGIRYWASTPSGQHRVDSIKLKLPIVGYFSRMGAVVQFSYTLGVLLESGVNLAQALDIVCASIDNRVLVDTLEQARDKIVKQGNIAQYLKQTNIFPPIAIYMIHTGEQSGNLGEMLLTVARNYEDDVTEFADTLTESLGPILLLVMALIVGFIIAAIVMPIVQMSQSAESMAGI